MFLVVSLHISLTSEIPFHTPLPRDRGDRRVLVSYGPVCLRSLESSKDGE